MVRGGHVVGVWVVPGDGNGESGGDVVGAVVVPGDG